MFIRKNKGEFGYIAWKRRLELGKTIFMFFLSFLLFLIGLVSTKTTANYLSVVAVLGCLPASKYLVSYIMFLKVKPSSSEIYEKIKTLNNQANVKYDLYFTTYEKNYSINALIVLQNKVLCFTEENAFKQKEFISYLESAFVLQKKKPIKIEIVDSIEKFLYRLQNSQNEVSEKTQEIYDFIGDITL